MFSKVLLSVRIMVYDRLGLVSRNFEHFWDVGKACDLARFLFLHV